MAFRLSPTDFEMLRAIAEYQIMTSPQLATLLSRSKKGVRDRISKLIAEGLLEEAKPQLARRIAKLHMGLGNTAGAANYFEKSGNPEQAADLYEEIGDHRGRARCLMHGIPAKGKLTPRQRKQVEQAAGALAQVEDPQAIDLYSRAGNVALAAELSRKHRDYPQAAQLFARAGRHAEPASVEEVAAWPSRCSWSTMKRPLFRRWRKG